MKVLHIQKVSGIGGSERHLLSLLPALRQRGIEITMCVLASGDADLFVDELSEQGVPVTTLPMGSHFVPGLHGQLRELITDLAPDIVHTHLVHADVYGLRAARSVGVVGVSSFHSTNPFFRKWWVRLLVRDAYRGVGRVIAISHHVARFLDQLGLVDDRKISTVHYGLDIEKWRSNLPSKEAARESLGLDADDFLVGVASRLFPNKGHRIVLQAMEVLPAASACVLVVAGSGPLRGELEEAAAGVSREVRFLGHIEDIQAFLAALDVFLFPTQEGFGEGFGLAALEAMASGVPIIASDIDSLPEIVAESETGFLVDPGDPHGWGDKILALEEADDLRLKLGLGARRRAETFTIDAMVDRTVAIYEQVLN